ncbi:hypothetical protein C8R44DRAFT_739273 [Mycena epipterygia]|nr:hypothetical protein C8R44DRAFT_739273 [Mycena epipterygia]
MSGISIPPEVARLDNTLLLVASWVNVALYTGELFLCRQYFQRPSRPLIHKIGVGALVFFDTLCTLATSIEVVLSVITFPNDLGSVQLLKPLAAVIFTTYAVASIEQAFLCNLYYNLTGNIFVSVVLALSVLVHFWRMISTFAPSKSTRSFVHRIMIVTVSSGAVVASNTLIMMILLLKHSPAFQFFFCCQGRVYSLMLLGNFLVGATFNPPSMIDTNPGGRVNTTLIFRVNGAHPENDDRPSSPLNTRTSPTGPPSNYVEEQIDLKQIPSLQRKPSSSDD